MAMDCKMGPEESNYITRGCAACVATAAMSDQHQEAGRESVALHTDPCSTLQAGRQPPSPTATSSKLLKTTCNIERATLTLQRYRPENAIIS